MTSPLHFWCRGLVAYLLPPLRDGRKSLKPFAVSQFMLTFAVLLTTPVCYEEDSIVITMCIVDGNKRRRAVCYVLEDG